VDGKKYTVDYERHISLAYPPSEPVFKGTVALDGDKDGAKHDVVIKFTSTYCEAAHRKLAEVRWAPSLRFCERVESVGMYVVVMDYYGGDSGKPFGDKEHIEQLREAVKTLHDADYVHGNLQEPNILVTAEGVKIVGFDWCGKAGVARYPADILGQHAGVRYGDPITKDHDERMFKLLTGSPY